jgi:HEAT repeat protein
MPLICKHTIAPAPPGRLPSESRQDLTASSSERRWAAARRLAMDPANAVVLGEALALETDARVREALFTGLARMQTPEAVRFVLPHLRSQDAAIRSGALDALNAIPQAVEMHLPGLLMDPDPDVRLLVCEIVRRLPGAVATRYLCDLLARETLANVCGAAVEALSEVGDETALPVLADCAARFGSEPFLIYAIKAATHRIAGSGVMRGPNVT